MKYLKHGKVQDAIVAIRRIDPKGKKTTGHWYGKGNICEGLMMLDIVKRDLMGE